MQIPRRQSTNKQIITELLGNLKDRMTNKKKDRNRRREALKMEFKGVDEFIDFKSAIRAYRTVRKSTLYVNPSAKQKRFTVAFRKK